MSVEAYETLKAFHYYNSALYRTLAMHNNTFNNNNFRDVKACWGQVTKKRVTISVIEAKIYYNRSMYKLSFKFIILG